MKIKEVELREIQKQDNLEIYKIIRKVLESYQLNKDGTAYTDPQLNQLYEFYQKNNRAEYWVMTKASSIIGGIGIAPFADYEEVAEIQKFYVKEEEQGKAYGKLLLNQALKYAEDNNYKKVYIETMDILERANNLYENYGFNSLSAPLNGSEHGLMNRWYIHSIV